MVFFWYLGRGSFWWWSFALEFERSSGTLKKTRFEPQEEQKSMMRRLIRTALTVKPSFVRFTCDIYIRTNQSTTRRQFFTANCNFFLSRLASLISQLELSNIILDDL
jgi:hypothetical protein